MSGFNASGLESDLQTQFSDTTGTANEAGTAVKDAIVDNYTDASSGVGNGQVAYGDSGNISSDANLTWNKTTKILNVLLGHIRAQRLSAQWTEIINKDASGGIIKNFSSESNKKPLSIQSSHNSAGTPAGALDIIFAIGPDSSLADFMRIRETGNVGINDSTPSFRLDVNGTGRFTGKLTLGGGSDPPYVLYDAETRQSIIDRVKLEIGNDKLNGCVMFFNSDTQNMELFLPSRGEFKSFNGDPLESVDPITDTYEVKDKYYLDPDTGEVLNMPVAKEQVGYRIKGDHILDSDTGEFYKVERDKEDREKIKSKVKAKKSDAVESFIK
jgi:hypothetical protein